MSNLYAIAIGSNRPHGRFGRPPQVVAEAIARLDRQFGLFDASPIVLNKAHGGAGRDFANSVALVESELDPPQMLAELKAIEREFGRRRGRRWAARVLDLDIVGDVRGDGFFYGIELVKDKATRETFDEVESEKLLRGFLSKALFENGLYCRADDRGDPVIQLSPPLVADQSHFDEMEQKLRSVLEEAWTKF